MIFKSHKGHRRSEVLWGLLKTSSLHLKNSFWSPWKYTAHRRSGGKLKWGRCSWIAHRWGDPGSFHHLYSIRPSRQWAVFFQTPPHGSLWVWARTSIQIYSERVWFLTTNEQNLILPCIVSLLLSLLPSVPMFKRLPWDPMQVLEGNADLQNNKPHGKLNYVVTAQRFPRECSQDFRVQKFFTAPSFLSASFIFS